MASKYREGDVVQNLTLVKRQGSDKDNRSVWLCQCVCGNNIVRNSSQLLSTVNDCGCISETQKIGLKYGNLTVVGFVSAGRNNIRTWKISCACGDTRNYATASLAKLKNDGDCGCGYSKGLVKGAYVGNIRLLEYCGLSGSYKRRSWKCLCSCGRSFEAQTIWFKQDRNSCHKCSKPNPKRMADGEAAFLALERLYRNNKRGISFDIPLQVFRKLVTSNCFYCDSPPLSIKKGTGLNNDFTYNGLDRINSDLTYTETNVVPCCKTVTT